MHKSVSEMSEDEAKEYIRNTIEFVCGTTLEEIEETFTHVGRASICSLDDEVGPFTKLAQDIEKNSLLLFPKSKTHNIFYMKVNRVNGVVEGRMFVLTRASYVFK